MDFIGCIQRWTCNNNNDTATGLASLVFEIPYETTMSKTKERQRPHDSGLKTGLEHYNTISHWKKKAQKKPLSKSFSLLWTFVSQIMTAAGSTSVADQLIIRLILRWRACIFRSTSNCLTEMTDEQEATPEANR